MIISTKFGSRKVCLVIDVTKLEKLSQKPPMGKAKDRSVAQKLVILGNLWE